MSTVEEIFHICICDTSMIHTNVAVLMYLFLLVYKSSVFSGKMACPNLLWTKILQKYTKGWSFGAASQNCDSVIRMNHSEWLVRVFLALGKGHVPHVTRMNIHWKGGKHLKLSEFLIRPVGESTRQICFLYNSGIKADKET